MAATTPPPPSLSAAASLRSTETGCVAGASADGAFPALVSVDQKAGNKLPAHAAVFGAGRRSKAIPCMHGVPQGGPLGAPRSAGGVVPADATVPVDERNQEDEQEGASQRHAYLQELRRHARERGEDGGSHVAAALYPQLQ
ncbi:hypothetical protein cyc_06425 [Cyclospora cayetanensis]|uniref:Uncharacterized protein n=1 Tax=Cyclospora cayetanensis TaxID=88456 RepID=A0A1D3CT04_9EIME|nr:hypothetical protein cyc_06425 [Cyclospora cayetanensis]